jgi:PAS domain S-box-containing protein
VIEFLSKLFSSDFMPHGHCYFWKPEIVWLHAASDGLIALSYYFIPLMLLYFVRKRRDLVFGWMFVMFGIFILGCGTTHLMEIWTLWHGTYRLAGIIKAITAGASLATAVALVPLIPRALALPSPAQLRVANLQLEREIGQRRRAEEVLQKAHGELELRVQERTAELASANEQLQAEIAERRRTTEELRKSEERWRAVFENSAVGIALKDLNGRWQALNPAFQKMLGYSEEELRDLSFLEITHEDDRESNWQAYAELLAEKRRNFAMEKRYRRKDGDSIWANVHVSLVPGTEDIPRFIMTIAEDISERKRTEKEMRKLASLVEHSRDFIGISSLEGDAEFVNPAGRAMVGLGGEEQIHGTKVLDYVADEDRRRFQDQSLAGVLRDGHWEGETLFRHFETGASFPVWQDIFSITDPGSERPLALATISRDITDRKRALEALQAAQAQVAHIARVTTMGELAASIAHEVNQPLTAVVTNGNACLRWLAGANPNLDEARAAVTRIVKEGSRAADIIRKIRALLKKSPPQIEPVDLNELIQEVLALARHEILRSAVSARTELADDLPAVPGDRVGLQQVILNLVMNAIEATRMIAQGPRELVISSQRRGPDQVVIAVSDSGIGFDPNNLSRLFNAFFTTKPDGMGMGLSISRSMIETHGGRLWATPNEGPGATFRFALPAAAEVHA